MSQGVPSPKRMRYMLRSSTTNEPFDSQPNEPTERKRKQNQKRKGPMQLMDLNDDCLLAIFGNLNAIELCDMAETCKRAQALTQYTFHMKHSRLDLSSIKRINLKLTARFLRNFGNDISSLHIPRKVLSPKESDVASRKILTLVGRHCGENLVELSLKNIRITGASMEHAKQVFGSLKTLMLENFCFKNCDLTIFTEHLEVLKLNNVDFLQASGTKPDNYKTLIAFFNAAKALKQLSMVKCTELPCRVLKAIGQLTHLQELEIELQMVAQERHVQQNLVHWFALKELKTLTIDGLGMSLQPLLEGFATNNVPIEHLDLIHIHDENIVESIVKLKSIKSLKVHGMHTINDANMLKLAKELKTLSKLSFIAGHPDEITQHGIVEMVRESKQLSCLEINIQDFEFGIGSYNDMLKAIQNRPNHIKLELIFHSDGLQMFDPDGDLRTNNKWLEVKEITDHLRFPMLPFFFIMIG